MDFKRTTALVTGGAKRVGRHIALRLARRGASILLHYHRSEREAEEVASEIRSMGVGCQLVRADLSNEADVVHLANQAVGVNLLVNSASIFYRTPVDGVSTTDVEKFWIVNFRAPFLLSTQIGRRLAEEGGGQIINIVDWSAFRPYRDYSAYCASKGALVTLTKSLARDLAPKVRANAVAPGPVLAPPGMGLEESQAIASLTVLGRWGKPDDVASAVVFLAENSYINGQVLVVDGGRSIL